MEHMSEMHQRMSAMHDAASTGLIDHILGATGRFAAQLLIILTSAPVLGALTALLLLLANAALLRLLLTKRASRS